VPGGLAEKGRRRSKRLYRIRGVGDVDKKSTPLKHSERRNPCRSMDTIKHYGVQPATSTDLPKPRGRKRGVPIVILQKKDSAPGVAQSESGY